MISIRDFFWRRKDNVHVSWLSAFLLIVVYVKMLKCVCKNQLPWILVREGLRNSKPVKLNMGDHGIVRRQNKQFYLPWSLLFFMLILLEGKQFPFLESFWMHFGILDFFPAFLAFSLLKFQVLWHLPPRSPPLLLVLRLMARSVVTGTLSLHA